MFQLFRVCVAMIFVVTGTVFGSASYVVLQEQDKNSLMRVSEDGKTVSVIAENCGGRSLALDQNGDYIIASKTALLRVTREGVVTRIAAAPTGLEWGAALIDKSGNLIATDSEGLALWKMAKGDESLVKFATMPGWKAAYVGDPGLAVDNSGNYLLMRLGDRFEPWLFRVTPAGKVSDVALSGAIRRASRSYLPFPEPADAFSGGPMLADDLGGFVFLDYFFTGNMFHLSATGKVEKLANFGINFPRSLARVLGSTDLLIGGERKILRASRDGSGATVFCSDVRIGNAVGILTEAVR